MTLWRKLSRLPPAERRLLLAAAALAAGVRLALRVAPFRLVRAALARVARPSHSVPPLPVPRIVWAVTAAAATHGHAMITSRMLDQRIGELRETRAWGTEIVAETEAPHRALP